MDEVKKKLWELYESAAKIEVPENRVNIQLNILIQLKDISNKDE